MPDAAARVTRSPHRITMVLVALLVASCASAASGALGVDRAACRVPTRVGRRRADATEAAAGIKQFQVDLVDHHRGTPATATRRARPCRVLPTQIRLPATRTPAPMIVMAHGLDGDPDALGPLADTWARAGYVVVAPMFPVTVKDEGGRSLPSETALQAGDLRFVLDRMLAGNRVRTRPWSGRIDRAHIGAAGMSLGGLAVYASTIESCCTDPRIDGAILMAAVYRDVPDSDQHANRIPMLLLQGDVDPGYHNGGDAYSDLVAPKWFVTLHGSRHAPPFEAPRGPEAAVVDPATIAFWDLALRHDPTGPARIVAAVRAHRRTTALRADPGPSASG
jgi:dienelactone hydrolase